MEELRRIERLNWHRQVGGTYGPISIKNCHCWCKCSLVTVRLSPHEFHYWPSWCLFVGGHGSYKSGHDATHVIPPHQPPAPPSYADIVTSTTHETPPILAQCHLPVSLFHLSSHLRVPCNFSSKSLHARSSSQHSNSRGFSYDRKL